MATVQEVFDSIAGEVARIDANTNAMQIQPRSVTIHIDDARVLLEWAKRMAEPHHSRPKRIPIRPIAANSGGKFDAKNEIDVLKQIARQLTDYVNELRRDVDRLQDNQGVSGVGDLRIVADK